MSHSLVVGAGTMGAGIASVLLAVGDEVEIVEATAELAASAAERIEALLADRARRGKSTEAQAEAALARLTVLASLDDATVEPDLAIEAVPERLELKRSVLATAELTRPRMLGSNTSSLSIAELAVALERPRDFLGLHFFNPVPAMALVEVVVGPETAPETVDAAVGLARRIGKEAVVVRDSPGFATSRLGVALGLEAIRMVEEAVADPAAIDTAMQLGYRHPIGPLRLTDIVGLDVRLNIARHLRSIYGERFAPPDLLVSMVADGHLGKKTGRGFYAWDADEAQ